MFFGPEYKVLRGGSFGVSPAACRGTFRNWDYPIRRQIFAGFRTARGAVSPGGRPPQTPRSWEETFPQTPPAPGALRAGHLAYLGRPPRCARLSSTRRTGCTGRPGRRAGSGTGR